MIFSTLKPNITWHNFSFSQLTVSCPETDGYSADNGINKMFRGILVC